MSDPAVIVLSMDSAQTEREWAREEFGLARLGDKRRVSRLIEVADRLANQPAGKVTQAFSVSAEREGTFRFLENDAVKASEIALASHRACARRVAKDEFAFVPVDGSSLNVTDRERKKGLGVVGARFVGATGMQVMSALAVSPEGVPMGLCGQTYWTRKERSPRGKKNRDPRPPEQRETQRWVSVMKQVRGVFASEAPQTRPWFQLDRGGDAWSVLDDLLATKDLFTVRAAYDRRVAKQSRNKKQRYLWETMESQQVLATVDLEMRSRPKKKNKQKVTPGRAARTAKIELRAASLQLDFCVDQRDKRKTSPKLYALLARETAESANGEEPIEWMLLTSYPIKSASDAQLVLRGYAQRWRIEEFHKCWKSGVCRIEETQLRAADNIERWATILAAVAVRVLRLTYLARHAPDLDAIAELAPCEIQAIVLGAKEQRCPPNEVPKLAKMVELLAKIGGYVANSSGGHPGPLVIARALLKIEVLADLLEMGLVTPVA